VLQAVCSYTSPVSRLVAVSDNACELALASGSDASFRPTDVQPDSHL